MYISIYRHIGRGSMPNSPSGAVPTCEAPRTLASAASRWRWALCPSPALLPKGPSINLMRTLGFDTTKNWASFLRVSSE